MSTRYLRRIVGHVEVYDAAHDASVFDADAGGRWVTVCDQHEHIVNHPRLADALEWAEDPHLWCPGCEADEERVRAIRVAEALAAVSGSLGRSAALRYR